jgi:triosephosphate isomerase (TIM)|tara:strand:- start:4879 stop:5646 length:768 start_codon:yes stop_codon:yes gene_type:complete
MNENKKIIIGNMKMNGSKEFNESLFSNLKQNLSTIDKLDIVLCLPYPYLYQAQKILADSNLFWGSQNVAKFENGAFTGEVSASMLKEFGSKFVIVGHSERSTAYCESDENIAEKFNIVKRFNMTPVLCVGETHIEREAGIMESVVSSQLDTIINLYGESILNNSIIAYEPIWAIGSDHAATPDQIQKMCSFIKKIVNKASKNNLKSLKVIYGGSVNSKNALQLCSLGSVDGALIGRASLDVNDFSNICQQVQEIV